MGSQPSWVARILKDQVYILGVFQNLALLLGMQVVSVACQKAQAPLQESPAGHDATFL